MKQKHHIFHLINKWTGEDVSGLLNGLLKPIDKPCIINNMPYNNNIESLDKLKTQNPNKFSALLQCGHIHNLFIVTALSVWEEFSIYHTESSLNSYVADCIKPVLTSDVFLRGNMIYEKTRTGIQECLVNKQL
jgi:hypothetical protein